MQKDCRFKTTAVVKRCKTGVRHTVEAFSSFSSSDRICSKVLQKVSELVHSDSTPVASQPSQTSVHKPGRLNRFDIDRLTSFPIKYHVPSNR